MATPIVSVKWLNQRKGNAHLVVLDASQNANKKGLKPDLENIQIMGSRFFDLKNTFSDQNSDLPNMLPNPQQFEKGCKKLGINSSDHIIVYDNLGIYYSPRVWWMFKTMGHEKVSVLDGGLPAWVSEGYETETSIAKEFNVGDFQARFQKDQLRDIGYIKGNLKDQKALLIDARAAGRFKGVAPEPRKGLKSGHIPFSINIPFQNVLDKEHYKSKTDLIELFEEIEQDKRPLIFSCGSGITACIVLLACEMVIQNHKSVYDGSWTEWAQTQQPLV